MGFQQLYTEQQVVNIVEQIGSRDMNYWLQAVDSVFLGIAPEIEILKAPITVALTSQHLGEAESWGGVVNNNYSYDLIEGKNYVVKATVRKLSGESQEVELSAIATLSTSSIKQPLLSFAVENDLRFTLEDKVHFELVEPYYTEGEDFSLVSAIDTSSKPYTWSYVTISSLIQKAPNTNLLKEPLNSMVSVENPVPIGYKLGLEVGKAYDIEFSIDGVIRTVTNISINMADLGEEIPANVLTGFVVQDTTKSESEATKGQFYVYDGINAEMQEAENSVYVFICQDSNGNAVTAQVLSIKEKTSDFEEFVTPLELNFDNSTTIQTPGADWCNGFIYKKSEFLKSIKDGDIVRITMDMFTTFNGEEFRFNDVNIDETALVDNEGLYLNLSLYNYTDDLFPTMYITDSNSSPSDYVFVGVALGEANINCKIKSMEISHGLLQSDVTLTTTKTSQNLDYGIGLKVNEYYDIGFYATDSSGGRVAYKDSAYAKTNTDGGVSLSIVRGSTNAIELEFVVIDGVSLNDSGQVTIDANSSAIRVSQFGNFVSVTVTSLLLSNK